MKQKIGILCPSDSEAAPFLADMEGVTETRKAMLRFYEGTFHGVDVVTLFSGVCKVNAALATQILIDSYQAGAVLNVGTAGALAPGLSVFDTVIATEAGYHDVSPEILTEFHPWLPAPGPRVPVGCEAAGPGPPGGRPGGAPCGVWTDGHRGDLPGGRGQTGGDPGRLAPAFRGYGDGRRCPCLLRQSGPFSGGSDPYRHR